jgi:hypothetical protein
VAGGFRVDLGALRQAADGVNGTLDQVSQRKVTDIPCAGPAMGNDRLASAVSDFCDHWQRGVDNLAMDGREIANRLTVSMNAYRAVDQRLHGHITGILQGTGPDPGAP